MAKLYIIRGIPGSGKSTYAEMLKKDLWEEGHDVARFEADDYWMKDGQYKIDLKRLPMAHQWCFDKTFNAFTKGCDTVIVSNTFTTMKEMSPYINEAKNRNLEIVVYRMGNEFKNVHNVPEEVIEKMKARFEDYENEIVIKNG